MKRHLPVIPWFSLRQSYRIVLSNIGPEIYP
jgi:hypothetical protein